MSLFGKNVKSIIESSRKFIEGLTDPLFITDLNLKIQYINKPALDALGYTEGEVVGKMTCADLCKTPLCNTANCTIKNCIETKNAVIGSTIAKTKSGKMIPVKAQCNVLFDSKGNPVGGFEYIADVTQIDEGFLANMADMAFRVNKELIIQNINEPALKALGYRSEDVLGKMTCAELCKTPVCGTDNCTVKNAMEKKTTVVTTTVAQTRNGKAVPVRASCGYTADAEGNVTGGFEIINAVDQLDEGFLANMADMAFRVDKDFIIQNINKPALDGLGYTREEVVGRMTCGDLCKTPACGTANCTIMNAIQKKTTVIATTVAQTRQGDLVPVRASCGYTADAEGNMTGGFEVISPVNQLDEGFLSNMADAAFRTDLDLVVQNINDAALNALGYTKEEVIGKMTCADLCKTPVCGTANCTIKTCVNTRGTIVAETVATTRDGAKIPVRASCGVLLDQMGNPSGGFEVITDNSALISMVENMGEIALGKLTAEVDGAYTERDDSVGKLANAFVEMRDSLKDKAGLLEKVADGDLTVDVNLSSDEDVLGNTLVKMQDSLNDALGQVNSSVEQVSSGSTQVSSASQSLSQGASEQASSLEEITSSLTEINSQAKQNADNATEANAISKQSMDNAENGNKQMKELVDAMSSINKSAEDIKKIVKVIDDIAFQINLLALNANVEAARAGKYGKGFAVVAEEVRNLAGRSAKSVQETNDMVEEALQNTEAGNKLVEATAAQLGEIVSGASKVTGLVEEIAEASKEQAQGLDQINVGLGQVDQVTQSNTSSAEECASASEELASQAQQLKAMVAKFKLSQLGNGNGKGKGAISSDMMQRMINAEVARQSGRSGHIENIHTMNQERETEANINTTLFLNDRNDAYTPSINNDGRFGGETKSSAPVKPEDIIKLDDSEFGKF